MSAQEPRPPSSVLDISVGFAASEVSNRVFKANAQQQVVVDGVQVRREAGDFQFAFDKWVAEVNNVERPVGCCFHTREIVVTIKFLEPIAKTLSIASVYLISKFDSQSLN